MSDLSFLLRDGTYGMVFTVLEKHKLIALENWGQIETRNVSRHGPGSRVGSLAKLCQNSTHRLMELISAMIYKISENKNRQDRLC